MISVLAYNIHYGKKLSLIESWLLKENAPKFDIICIQEFPFSKSSPFLEKFKELSYDYAFGPSFKRRGIQYGELTLYNSKELKLLDKKVIKLGTILLEDRSFRTRFRKTGGQRTSMLTLFKHKDQKIIIANSHLFCFALNSHRIGQLTKILNQIHKLNVDEKSSAIILGDFNYTSIIRQKKLINFMQSYSFVNAYKTNTHKLFFLKHQLDYVFYKNCKVGKILIDKLKYSDHLPVQFGINLN